MALSKLIISFAAILSLVSAQSNNTQLQIESIEAQFQNAGLVPIPVPVFSPTALLTASFNGVGNITPGQPLTQSRELICGTTWFKR
jgi:phosphatidylethanolamine-binding protein